MPGGLLRAVRRVRQSPGVEPDGNARLVRAQLVLGAATLLAYAIGYPVAIIGHSGFGWVLVTIGGVLLMVFGGVTIVRIHRGSDT